MKALVFALLLVPSLVLACPNNIPINRIGLNWFILNQHANPCIKQPAQANVWWKNKWECRVADDLYYALYETDNGVDYSLTSAVEHRANGTVLASFLYSCNCNGCGLL